MWRWSLAHVVVWIAMSVSLPIGAPRADYVSGLDPDGDNFLALRTGPDKTYPTIVRMGPDTVVTVLQRRGPWARVRLENGAEGWAFSAYLSAGLPPGYEASSRETEFGTEEAGAPEELVPAPAQTGPAPVVGSWTVYANDRFGTTIEYPATIFRMLPPPANDDGRRFAARQGTAGFLVFGVANAFEKTLAELIDDDLASGDYAAVSYRRTGTDWYVLSGYRASDVFYRKVILSGGGAVIHTFEIVYPKAAKPVFDAVTARMAKSMRAGAAVAPSYEATVATPEEDSPTAKTAIPAEPQAEPSGESAPSAPPPADSWRSPLEEILFSGEQSSLFLLHEAHGGNFASQAHYADGALLVDVPAGSAWGMVGLLTNDAVVWLDDFHDDAVVRVTFTLDPQRTTGFAVALAQPGWGRVSGNDPSYPSLRYFWIRQSDGASAKAEFHVDPHRETDFWHDAVAPTPPTKVAFVLKPGIAALEVDGVKIDERPFDALTSGNGFRIYAYSHPVAANAPVKMALKGIRVDRTYPAKPVAAEPAPGVAPLPHEVLFDGKASDRFTPVGIAGGDFAKFARYGDGALVVDVPKGNNWGKTGLLSNEPLVTLDDRVRQTPTRVTLMVDPARTSQFVFVLSTKQVADMWGDYQAWFTFARPRGEPAYALSVQSSVYQEWTRKVPAAWMDAYWDGTLQFDIGNAHACLRVPNGPAVCGKITSAPGYAFYATILAHPPEPNAATRLALKSISRELVTPPGMTAEQRWSYVSDEAFDPDAFLDELAGAGQEQKP